MFGNHLKTIDEKNRIIIPSQFREELGEVFYISLGLDKIVEIRSKSEFDRIKEKMKANNSLNKNLREFARFFFGNTTEASCDKVGRVVLPKNLLNLVAIKNEAYLIGVGEKIELWPKERYEEHQSKFMDENSIDELQNKLFESGVEL
ncbi:division/cell wall cluster transcriptional repressor MraZ [Mesomycoplasma lagogenitalium]|uniref:Transcriptional regulator MraZ n=1 Tax=Mesomycoplasma lagogenitalium TaxID=171286 RepID=A0ABY8LU56_9BACT|nr:division/cell wall cluster transcriptional repressor MraZ [Mesomycoplasma lagogenitalium]WGI36255.1 division/cell wall cluster transcriptional repressor MraZ [Mesomycoplasma lagogenitalium]